MSLCVHVCGGSGFEDPVFGLIILRVWGWCNTSGRKIKELPVGRKRNTSETLEHLGVCYVMKFNEICDETCIDIY